MAGRELDKVQSPSLPGWDVRSRPGSEADLGAAERRRWGGFFWSCFGPNFAFSAVLFEVGSCLMVMKTAVKTIESAV